MNEYQLAVLGGGPGGYTAAIRADQLGIKTVLIERNKLGGTCLNRGCIPTKALLSTTDILRKFKKSGEFGIDAENISYDMNRIMERKNAIVTSLVEGLDKLFRMRKIEVLREAGRLTGRNCIELDSGKTVTADNIILATGSKPLELPFFNIDHKNVITSDDALCLTELPASMLIIGGGVVGCEFAGIYSELGVDITIVEMLDSLLPLEDKQISRTLQTSFKKKAIKIRTKCKVESIDINGNGQVTVSLDDGTSSVYEKVLAAGGRSLNIDPAWEKDLGIKTEKGFVKINDEMKTDADNIYAIGDITGKMMLAHCAAAQGIAAVSNIAGSKHVIDYTSIPSAVFTDPEIASVGYTEQQLKEEGIEYRTGRFSFAASGKAKGLGETDGFVKVLTDSDGERLLGAHIAGPHASDLIQELVIIRQNGLPLHDLINSIHSHPTLSECVLEASESIFKRSIHSI